MQQIRIHRPGVRHERPWHEDIPPDPDVVRITAGSVPGQSGHDRGERSASRAGAPVARHHYADEHKRNAARWDPARLTAPLGVVASLIRAPATSALRPAVTPISPDDLT